MLDKSLISETFTRKLRKLFEKKKQKPIQHNILNVCKSISLSTSMTTTKIYSISYTFINL